ncbi:MAG: hypothetical protein IKS94_04155, partial [Prevotella sp.]|nr:hypothetical protein [Prevotella sp.]
DDGYYTDSSDGGTKKHTWRLASDANDGSPYYGGIYLDGVYYEIISLGDGHWRLKDRNGKILDFGRDGGTSNNEDDPNVSSGDYVNLGLPSGTLWASCNVGAKKPEEYGDQFAWGETKPKKDYRWSTYKWCNGSSSSLTKYTGSDGKTELDLEDDAAYVNCGKQWRTPSIEQINELINNCKWEWTTLNGVGGSKVTSKNNGKSIFLPAESLRSGTELLEAYHCGDYWSRSIDKSDPTSAYSLYFDKSAEKDAYYRCEGLLVRPVRLK